MRRVNIKIYGRVQGVFFRYNTKKVADKLNLRGCVKNKPDDSVEIVAEGKDEDIESLIRWCRKGPIGSKVENVGIDEDDFKDEFKSFSIIY